MSTEATTRPPDARPDARPEVRPAKLWFGFAASAAAWFTLGLADMFITWRMCIYHEQFGGSISHPGMRALNIVVTLALIALTVAAGITSYRNWRRLSAQTRLLHAEGRGRREYMALIGVFVSLTLGVGMIWLALPLLILDLCVRTR